MPRNGKARTDQTGPMKARRADTGRGPKETTVLLQLRAYQESEARKRRRHYRTSPPSRRSIKIYVGNERKRSWKGFIEDVTSGGARLSFPGEEHPRYALHESVFVQICSPYLELPLVVPSIVCYRYESVERATYGFEFKKRPGDLIELPAALKQVFNRRRDRRVRPAPGKPIHLTVSASADERFETFVHDISTSGLAFVVTGNDGAFLVPGDPVDVELRLPGSRETFRVKAMLCAREQVLEGLRFGVLFQTGNSSDLAPLKSALAKYVRERRRETARGHPPGRTGLKR